MAKSQNQEGQDKNKAGIGNETQEGQEEGQEDFMGAIPMGRKMSGTPTGFDTVTRAKSIVANVLEAIESSETHEAIVKTYGKGIKELYASNKTMVDRMIVGWALRNLQVSPAVIKSIVSAQKYGRDTV